MLLMWQYLEGLGRGGWSDKIPLGRKVKPFINLKRRVSLEIAL